MTYPRAELVKGRAVCLTMTWCSFLILNRSVSFNNDHKSVTQIQLRHFNSLHLGKWSPQPLFPLPTFQKGWDSHLWDLNQVPGMRSRESWEYDIICSNWSSPLLTLLFSTLLKPLSLRICTYQCTLWSHLDYHTAEFRARRGLKNI